MGKWNGSDYQEVQELAYLFGRANDERTDMALAYLEQCLDEDVEVIYEFGRWRGLEAHKRVLKAAQTCFLFTHHIVSNPIIRIAGDEAEGEYKMCSPHGVMAGGVLHTVWVGGMYRQRSRRTAKGWRVVHHECRTSWSQGDASLLDSVGVAVAAVLS